MSRNDVSQRGAALVTALVFLVILTLLSVTSIRSSTMGVRMALNEEARFASLQAAQAMTEAIIGTPGATLVIGGAGFTNCTSGEANCDRYTLPVPDGYLAAEVAAENLSARVNRLTAPDMPPPRALESSMDKFSATGFQVTATFDRTDDGLGRARLVEGLLVLVPRD
jgi:hypothetical protein